MPNMPAVRDGFIECCVKFGITKQAFLEELWGKAKGALEGMEPHEVALLTGAAGGVGGYGGAKLLGAKDPWKWGVGGALAGAGAGGFGKSYYDSIMKHRGQVADRTAKADQLRAQQEALTARAAAEAEAKRQAPGELRRSLEEPRARRSQREEQQRITQDEPYYKREKMEGERRELQQSQAGPSLRRSEREIEQRGKQEGSSLKERERILKSIGMSAVYPVDKIMKKIDQLKLQLLQWGKMPGIDPRMLQEGQQSMMDQMKILQEKLQQAQQEDVSRAERGGRPR